MSGMLLLILFIMSLPAAAPAAKPPFQMPTEIVWLDQKGPGGGGGGGGNKMPEPAEKAELPGKEKITVPVAKPPKLEPDAAEGNPEAGRAADDSRADDGDRRPGAAGRDLEPADAADAVAGLRQRRMALAPGRELESVRGAAPGSATVKAAAPAAASTGPATASSRRG